MNILKFEQDHPPLKAGKKRGSLDHVEFSESYKKVTQVGDKALSKWFGKTSWVKFQKRTRGWNLSQSMAKWNEYKVQGVPSDMQGLDKDDP